MIFLPFGSVYASVDCLFHEDAEHISHGIEIAENYQHSHDSIFLNAEEQRVLSSSGENLGDTSVETYLDNQCSSGLLIVTSMDSEMGFAVQLEDPFSYAEPIYGFNSIPLTKAIRPPIV